MTSTARLDALIDELTVDAYDDAEQLIGFLTGAEEALQHGELAQIVGVDIEVVAIDAGPDMRTSLIARVRRAGGTYEVALADLRFRPRANSGSWSRRTVVGKSAGDHRASDPAPQP